MEISAAGIFRRSGTETVPPSKGIFGKKTGKFLPLCRCAGWRGIHCGARDSLIFSHFECINFQIVIYAKSQNKQKRLVITGQICYNITNRLARRSGGAGKKARCWGERDGFMRHCAAFPKAGDLSRSLPPGTYLQCYQSGSGQITRAAFFPIPGPRVGADTN